MAIKVLRETYKGYELEAFPAMLGWEIQAIKDGRHAFTFMTMADDAAACLRIGRGHIDAILSPRIPYAGQRPMGRGRRDHRRN